MITADASPAARDFRRFDRERYLCALFAPTPARDAIAAVHAVNSEIAQIRERIREPLLGHIRLRWWQDAIAGLYAGSPPAHPLLAGLTAAVDCFGLSRHYFDAILDARALDLDDAPPPSVAALLDYAERTSGSLACLTLEILGCRDDGAVAAARHVGTAWALSGLLRAVPFHARSRRTFLPADLCREAGLDATRLFDRGLVPGLTKVAAAVADLARERLVQARVRRALVSRAALPAVLPAVLADGHLHRLARAGYNPFDPSLTKPRPLDVPRLIVAHWRGRY